MTGILLRYVIGRVVRYFAHDRTARLITVGAFIVVLSFFAFEMYMAFRYGFRAIARDAFLEEALLLYVIELFTLVSFLLLTASAGMSGLWSLCRSDRDTILMASPRYTLKPILVFIRVFLLASWPLFLVMLPAFVALGETYQMGIGGAVLAFAAMLVLVAIAILLSFIAILLLAHTLAFVARFSQSTLFSRGVLAVMALILYGVFLVSVADRFASMSLVRFFQARVLEVDTPDLDPILALFQTLPSHPAAEILFYMATGNIAKAVMPFAVLLGLFAVLLGLLFIFSRSFLTPWQALLEQTRGGGFLRRTLLSGIFARVTGPDTALLAKEAVMLIRDARGMLWLFFIILIWLMQVGAARILAHHLEDERVAVGGAGMIEMVALVTIIYFASILVLRFVFPSFSSERNTAWIIRCAPVNLFRSYVVKLSFFSVAILIITSAFAVLHLSTVGIDSSTTAMLLCLYVIIATCIVVTLGLSLGAIFPNTQTDDPELLSTTLPGLTFIGGVLTYGAGAAMLFWSTRYVGPILPLLVLFTLSFVVARFLVVYSRKALLRPIE